MNASSFAIVLSGALIAAAIYFRPETPAAAVYAPVGDHINVRLNTATGQMVMCRPDETFCRVTVPAGEMKPKAG